MRFPVEKTADNPASLSLQAEFEIHSMCMDPGKAQFAPSGRKIRMEFDSLLRESHSENSVMNCGKESGGAPVLMFFCRMSPELRISGPSMIDLPDPVVFLNQTAVILQFRSEQICFAEHGAGKHPDAVDLRPDGDVLRGLVAAVRRSGFPAPEIVVVQTRPDYRQPRPFFYFPEKFSPPQNGEFFGSSALCVKNGNGISGTPVQSSPNPA